MKRTITIFSLITLFILGLFLGNQALLLAKPSDTMTTANQLYETGQFNLAAQSYQQLVDQGYTDSVLFYNLGNAYFKNGDYGRAILNYRRAELLAPHDVDITANLNMARTQIVDQLEPTDTAGSGNKSIIATVENWTQQWLSLNQLALVALGAWVLFVFLFILLSNTRKGTTFRESLQYVMAITALVLVIGIVGLVSRLYANNAQTEAVVVAQEVNVTSGPGAQYVTEFTLHNGTEIQVLEHRGNWARLALADNSMQGWAPANTVETIN